MLALWLALVVAACGGNGNSSGAEQSAAESPSAVALDGAWLLVDGTVDGAALALVDGYRVTLTINGTQITGTAACNGYGGSLSQRASEIAIGGLAITEMGCQPDVMAVESAYVSSKARRGRSTT